LFFRYDSRAKIIVYAWVNDEKSLRTYGARTDAYAVFSKMLTNGNPPHDWDDLLAACQNAETLSNLLTDDTDT
jgi:toxin YhaV